MIVNDNAVDAAEEYKVIRAQIEHIDNNVSQRVIWLVIAQSFFFSGYAVLINGQPPKPQLEPIHEAFVIIFPIAALLTVFFTFIDVFNGIRYMRDLRMYFEKADKKDDKTAKSYPPILGIPRQRILMHVSPLLIPILFMITWIVVLIIQYTVHPAPPPPAPGH